MPHKILTGGNFANISSDNISGFMKGSDDNCDLGCAVYEEIQTPRIVWLMILSLKAYMKLGEYLNLISSAG